MSKLSLKKLKSTQTHCAICNKKPKGPLTKDHIIPVSFGGKSGKNIRFVCRRCNGTRGNRITLSEWGLMNNKQKDLFWEWIRLRVQQMIDDKEHPFFRKVICTVFLHILEQRDFAKTHPLLFIFKIW